MTADLAAFFLERYASEMPTRTHSRDTSEDGGPEWHRAFEAWLTDGECSRWSVAVSESQDYCNHPTAENPCPICDGTGLRVRTRSVFRHPIKKALATLHTIPVPKGRPRLDVTLMALAANDGNVFLAIDALSASYSFMWQPAKARRWMMHALWKFRAAYREDAPARVLRKSESQEIAEVAA